MAICVEDWDVLGVELCDWDDVSACDRDPDDVLDCVIVPEFEEVADDERVLLRVIVGLIDCDRV